MSNISAKELQQNLESILDRAQSERIVISRHGKPCAVLLGIEAYDAEDLLLATSEDFWQIICYRRNSGESLPLAEVEARLGITGGKTSGKRGASPKLLKGS